MGSDRTEGEPAAATGAPERAQASTGFLKDVFQYVPALAVPAIVGIVTVPVVTRLLDPDEYGLLSVAYATLAIALTLLGWVPTAVIRFLPAAERERTLPRFYGTVQLLLLLSVAAAGALGAVLLLGVGDLLEPELARLLWIGLAVLAAGNALSTYQFVLRARRQVTTYSLIAGWRSAGTLGIGVFFVVAFGLGTAGLMWGGALAALVALPLAWWRALGREGRWQLGLDRALAASMARYSVPLVVGNIAAWVLNLSDRYVIGLTRGSHEVGIYAVTYDLGQRGMMLVVSLILLAAGPLAMRVWERQGEAQSRLFAADVTRYFLLASAVLVVGLACLSDPFLRLMAAEPFHVGHPLLGIVALATFFHGLQGCFHVGLLVHKKTLALAVALLVAGALNVALNVVLVPRYGYFAAAVTTLVSTAALFVLVVVLSRRYFTWRFPFPTLLRVLAASATTGALLLGVVVRLPLSPAGQVVLGALAGLAVYVLTLVLLGEPRAEEKAAVRRALRRVLGRKGDAR